MDCHVFTYQMGRNVISIYLAVLHHESDPFQFGNISKGISR